MAKFIRHKNEDLHDMQCMYNQSYSLFFTENWKVLKHNVGSRGTLLQKDLRIHCKRQWSSNEETILKPGTVKERRERERERERDRERESEREHVCMFYARKLHEKKKQVTSIYACITVISLRGEHKTPQYGPLPHPSCPLGQREQFGRNSGSQKSETWSQKKQLYCD